MASFQVPQFIEEKPKIISFFTLQQFLLLGGAAIASIVLYYIFSMFLWVILSALIVGSAIALGFVKINGQELPKVVRAAFRYYWNPRRYVWQRAMEETSLDTSSLEKISSLRRSMSIQEKFKKIADSITTGKIFKPEDSLPDGTKLPKGKYEVVTYLTGEKRAAKRVDF
ncbi:MAG: Uncharacterized protein LiPW41_128 [Parcubacteria group bacterium LiPW_41]|nr:MAG: Uncharacterized protein LiPW41_128 [Parcubacteria group bacterium LiPW_41]